MKPNSRVLVIRGGAIGDFILTLPAIRLLRDSIPGCHLEVLGYPGIAQLAVKAGLAQAVRSLEHRHMAQLFGRNAPIDEALAAYLASFNLVVSYLYDPDGHFRASLERAGVKTLIEGSHRVVPGQGPAAAQLARPLERLAMFLEDPAPRFFCGPTQGEGAGQETGAGPERLRIAIHPGSGSETKKNWPLAHWLALAREVREGHPGAAIHFITGEAEEARGMLAPVRIAAAALGAALWHGWPLAALADALADCGVFLGHDSGISHLAAACGARCLLLFGPTDPQTWAPATARVTVLQADAGDLTRLPYAAVAESALAMLEAHAADSWPCSPSATC